jgi:lambda family phage tail tape measure protein
MATIENFILRFKVEGKQAVDGVKNSINGLKADLDNFAQVGGPLSNTIGSITGKLGPLGAAATAGAAAFVVLGMKAINLADEIQDMADATGIGAGQLLNLKQSIVEAGGKADSFATVASKLSVAVGEAMGGNEKYQKSFKDLGVFVTDASGKVRDSGDILQDVVGKLAAIEDPSVRAAKAVEILGKEAAKIDWSKVSAGKDAIKDEQIAQLAAYRGEMDKLANTIQTKLITVFGELATAVNKGGLVEGLAAAVEQMGYLVSYIPGLGKMRDLVDKARMERIGGANGGGRGGQGGPTAEELRKYQESQAGTPAAGGYGGMSESKLKALEESRLRIQKSGLEVRKQNELATANDIQKIEIAAQYEAQSARAEILAKGKELGLNFANEAAAKEAEIYAKRDTDIANARRQLNAKIAQEEMAQAETFAKEMAAYYQQVDQARLAAFDQADGIRKQTEELQGRFDLQQKSVDLSSLEQDRVTKLFDLEQQRKATLEAISKIKDLPYDERIAREKQINAEYEKRIGLINQEAETRAKREQDFGAGIRESMKRYEESLTPLKRGEQMANSVFSNMDNALRGFVDTGKFNFKDFANSVIRDLILIELRASTVSLFKSVFGGLGTALGFRANGGPVSSGQPYVVGERGAELFVPNTGGTIVSNAQLAGGGGMLGTSNVIYNINAVDASSFKQLIARDPGFIYAVTEQGRKAVPSTRR